MFVRNSPKNMKRCVFERNSKKTVTMKMNEHCMPSSKAAATNAASSDTKPRTVDPMAIKLMKIRTRRNSQENVFIVEKLDTKNQLAGPSMANQETR